MKQCQTYLVIQDYINSFNNVAIIYQMHLMVTNACYSLSNSKNGLKIYN